MKSLPIWVGFTLILARSVTSRDNFAYTSEEVLQKGIDFTELAQRIVNRDIADVSDECYSQVRYLTEHKNGTDLLKMADAWSKFPYPGAFYYASKSDWGNYDECIKVSADVQPIYGKFCAWGFVIPASNSSAFLLAYCVPQGCSAADLNNATGLPLFNDQYCSTKETDNDFAQDTGAAVAAIIFGLFFLFALVSTAFDVYLHYSGKKSPSNLFVAFSFYSNGKKLLQSTRTSHAGDQILCFHGMKFISMWWIISGHGAISWFLSPVMDTEFRANWQQQQYAQYIASAHISVDTFFYISGFLMAYLYFKQDLSRKPIVQQVAAVPMMIVHRYIRLTPPNAMCFLGAVFLFKYMQDGPFFSYGIHTGLIEPCKSYWWTFFLYIQNYYNFQISESLCIPTTWYLSADFQLFLVAPLVLIPLSLLYRRSFMTTMAALLVINVAFLCLPIYIRLQFRDYDPTFQEYDFHSKLISYFIGVMAGVYMRHQRAKHIPISRVVNLILWFLSLGTMLAVIFYRQKIQIGNEYVSRSLCYSFTRPMWCCSLAWITYACVKGYGGVVNWFLSSSFMQLGGKLTYCLYIVHGMVIAHFSLGVRHRQDFTDWHIFYQNCGYFIVAMMVATFWSLSYESPILIIEKVIFGPGKPKVTVVANRPVTATSETNGTKEQ